MGRRRKTAKAYITGDSHTLALAAGLEAMAADGEAGANYPIRVRMLARTGFFRDKFFAREADHIKFVNPPPRSRDMQLPLPKEKGVVYGISGILSYGRVFGAAAAGLFAAAPLAEAETPLSEAVLTQMYSDDLRDMFALVDEMRDLKLDVFVVEAPPRFQNHPMFTGEAGPYPKARKQAVVDLDRRFGAYARAELAKRSVPVIDVPKHCLDEDGLMLAAFNTTRLENDYIHANAEFGRIMLGEVERFLKERH